MTPDSNPNQNSAVAIPGNTTVNPKTIVNNSIQEDLITETQQTLTEKAEGKTVPKSKYSKRKIGDGLHEKFKDGEFAGYQFRKMINGISMNISLGKMTEEQAKKEIERLAKKPSQLQRNKKVEVALSKMKGQKEETMPCFKSYIDARQFSEALYKELMHSKFAFQNRASDGLDLEIYTIIWTMLSTPLSLDELLNSSHGKLLLPDYLTDILQPDKIKRATILLYQGQPNEQPFSVLLTNATTQAILALVPQQASNPYQSIFHRMKTLGREESIKRIVSKLRMIWTGYPIQLEAFTLFFQYVANRHSSFRQDFIESYIKKQAGSLRWLDYDDDRKALSAWWEKQIIEKKFHFQSMLRLKTIEAANPHSESNLDRPAPKFQAPKRRPPKQTDLPNS
ncbi:MULTISPECIES: hypothetical protein [unclassified Undibacterium]|uniref:hypothetical protein n=1 Tax=unclassified Undibacterium TaxID=2630295 RepID=UPI003BF3946C